MRKGQEFLMYTEAVKLIASVVHQLDSEAADKERVEREIQKQ